MTDELVDAWLAECTDGRVSGHTITMLRTFARWLQPAIDAAREEGRRAGLEEAAKVVEVFAQGLEKGADDNVSNHLNSRMCCDGHMCGCQGVSVGEYLAYALRAFFRAKGGDHGNAD